ncbi:DUF3180 domain-containing protein [Microlunatus soli]|uniref:DUF3180 domain-containing protein n=1 Tax=Microlunatus soli TaxID=630515 RepID=A0A1H1SK67_9ACTN|nr:DUF3180 domain-containing protein [Microlunatus soli]SDS48397.1 Protein of unknown function [Microlunatus soli]
MAVGALVGALIGWSIAAISGRDGIPIRVAWSGPITLLAAAAVLVCIAYVLHQRMQVNRIRVDDRQAVAWLALGKAAALLGMLMAGGYLGFAVRFLGDLQTDAPRERVIRSMVAVIGGVAITVAALRIERACMVPPRDDDEKQD